MRTPLILITVILSLPACSSTPKTTSTYLLRSSNSMENRELSVTGALSLGSLKVAGYIDQPSLVLEQANGTIHMARHHKWAEPLRQSLRPFLCSELSANLGYDVLDSVKPSSTSKRLDVALTRLHGDANGNAVLSARWKLTKEESLKSFQFAKTIPLDGVGYDALVNAHKKLLTDLAGAIAQTAK